MSAFGLPPPPGSGRNSDRSLRGAGPGSQKVKMSSQPSTDSIVSVDDYVLYVALYDYNSNEDGDLTFDSGDILQVTEEGETPESWFYGRAQDGREGSFPGTYVRKVKVNKAKKLTVTTDGDAEPAAAAQPSHNKPPPSYAAADPVIKTAAPAAVAPVVRAPPPVVAAPVKQEEESFTLYQTLYAYNSSDPDDLTFDANEILRVYDEGDGPESWFEGENQDGKRGCFPGTYVRKIGMKKGLVKVGGLDHT